MMVTSSVVVTAEACVAIDDSLLHMTIYRVINRGRGAVECVECFESSRPLYDFL
jgi:hypothetical protein